MWIKYIYGFTYQYLCFESLEPYHSYMFLVKYYWAFTTSTFCFWINNSVRELIVVLSLYRLLSSFTVIPFKIISLRHAMHLYQRVFSFKAVLVLILLEWPSELPSCCSWYHQSRHVFFVEFSLSFENKKKSRWFVCSLKILWQTTLYVQICCHGAKFMNFWQNVLALFASLFHGIFSKLPNSRSD